MKRIYMTPLAEVVGVEVESLLNATSNEVDINKDPGDDTIDDPDDMLSRRGRQIWDEEEELEDDYGYGY